MWRCMLANGSGTLKQWRGKAVMQCAAAATLRALMCYPTCQGVAQCRQNRALFLRADFAVYAQLPANNTFWFNPNKAGLLDGDWHWQGCSLL